MDICVDKEQYIALVAPASPAVSEEDVERTAEYLRARGFKVIYGEDTYQRVDAKRRAEILMNYIFDSTVSTIWAVRGGEGSADIIPHLEVMREQIALQTPKCLIGFSDVSALLVYFSQQYNWPAIHGMVATQFLRKKINEETKEQTINLFTRSHYEVRFDRLEPMNDLAREHGSIEAPLIATNLTLFDLSVKDVWEIDASGCILMIEDMGEKGYRLIRILKHLNRIGLLNDLKAIIYGDFNAEVIGSTDADQEQEAFFIIKELKEFAVSCDVPVFMTEQFGHGGINFPIALKAMGHLEISECSKLTYRA